MRKVLIAAALLAAALVEAGPAAAVDFPWCGVYSTGRGSAYWDCRYRTVEECVPNILSGNRGFCVQNPALDEASKAAAKKPRKKKRPQ